MAASTAKPAPALPADHRDALAVAMTVRMARAALGWSQLELGRHLGMTQRSVHRIEQGHVQPRRTTLLAIEGLLRRAGLEIRHHDDGGFCVEVPASLSRHHDAETVAAPKLADLSMPGGDENLDLPARREVELNSSGRR